MPIYSYECKICGEKWEGFRKMNDRHNEKCFCGAQAAVVMSLTAKPVVYDYYSEGLGCHITGKKQKSKIMKKKGLEEYERS